MIDEKIVKDMISESSYLSELYNIFNVVSNLVDGDIKSNVNILTKLEDMIYTVNENVLTNQERLSIELKKIIRINENNNNLNSKEIISKKIQNILEIMDEVFDNKIDDYYILDSVKERYEMVKKDAIFSMKKKIAIIESELNIPISFFEAASFAFLDIYKKYRNAYQDSYTLSKEIGDKYEYI